MTLLRSAQSLEYVRVPVATTDSTGAVVNPTGDVVALAFLDRTTKPVAGTTYVSATWDTDTSDPAAPVYYAKLLVGPGAPYVPTPGTQMVVWVKVTDNPEVPVIRAGDIRFE
jgi:hypothetical protein